MNELLDVLRQSQDRQGMTIDDLVDEADRLLPVVADHQTRYKVTDRPDVRTIRYYVTRGLLPKADGYEGGRARYGGAHLIRLLLIKKLQAEHHTLTRISGLLDAADDGSVLRLLLGEDPHSRETREAGPERTAPPSEPGETPTSVATSISKPGPLPGRTVQRVELYGGASLEVPPETIASPAERVALARALEAAAATLRGEQEDERKDEQDEHDEQKTDKKANRRTDRNANRKSNRTQRANRKGETT